MSDKKNLSNLSDSTRNSILKKKSSYELKHVSNINNDTELSINNNDHYKLKKPSYNSDQSDGSSRSLRSIISNIFQKKSHSHIQSMTMSPVNEDYISYDSNEKFASHVAISPDGQYVCTFDSSKHYLFYLLLSHIILLSSFYIIFYNYYFICLYKII